MGALIIRKPEVLKRVGFGRTTLQQLVKSGEFPKPIKLAGPEARAVGWVASEVELWIEQKIAGRDAKIARGAK
jgi:prophage regulatory protein